MLPSPASCGHKRPYLEKLEKNLGTALMPGGLHELPFGRLAEALLHQADHLGTQSS